MIPKQISIIRNFAIASVRSLIAMTIIVSTYTNFNWENRLMDLEENLNINGIANELEASNFIKYVVGESMLAKI